jgi:hypothetical protein
VDVSGSSLYMFLGSFYDYVGVLKMAFDRSDLLGVCIYWRYCYFETQSIVWF